MTVVQALCRVCNKHAPSDKFKLHHVYRQMVCPDCYTGRTKRAQDEEKKKEQQEKVKPAGWDKEDDYLEQAQLKRNDEIKAQFSKIPGTDRVRCTCSSCKYQFKYDPFKKMPLSCPYCGFQIPKLRTFNLL